jgi:membrane complex biogenesis BtpA family protein
MHSTPGHPETFRPVFDVAMPVIGMVHLPALPGSPRCDMDGGFGKAWSRIHSSVIADAKALAAGGVDAIMIENFGDVPFFPGNNPPHVLSLMTSIASSIRAETGKKIGINVLRNDGIAALAIAVASGASFIRVNVLSGARVTDQGVVEGAAHEIMRYRQQIGAGHVAVFADVQVKHSTPLGTAAPLGQDVDDLCKRALADGIIVSGSGTGKPVDLDSLRATKVAADKHPVFIGSGATLENVNEISRHADGLIVGTAFKRGGSLEAPVDASRVAAFMAVVGGIRSRARGQG